MNSLVEAINTKFEELNNGAIIGVLSSRASSASFRPSKVLFMDGLGIKTIGDLEELKRIAGHVEELDLSANNIDSWKEVFILLESLPRLRSINLSYNPLGQDYVVTKPIEIPVTSSDSIKRLPMLESNFIKRSARKASYASSSDSANGSSLYSTESSTTVFGDRSSLSSNFSNINELEEAMDISSPIPTLGSDFHNDNRMWICDSEEDYSFENCEYTEFKKSDNDQPLSPCKFALRKGLITDKTSYPQLQALILNSTNIPWPWVTEILERCPNLSELHLALNSYGSETGHLDHHYETDLPSIPFTSVTNLFYSQNGPLKWESVVAFEAIFPNLEHLVLLGNQLSFIPHYVQRDTPILQKLKQLCLNDTFIHEWCSIDNLSQWLPHLHTLKLGLSLPLFEGLSKVDCRNQVIARMPNLKVYNAVVISHDEREQAERDFIRQYSTLDPSNRPKMFLKLERKHGALQPLVEIDLTPKKSVKVRVEYQGQEHWHTLSMTHSIGQAKLEFASLFGLCDNSSDSSNRAYQMKNLKLFYYDQVMCQAQGPEELRYITRKVHSLQPDDGDMFQLVRVEKVD